jgi:transposase
MCKKAFSEDLKWRVIYLYKDGYSTKQIKQLLYISKSMINKIIQTFECWGCVVNPLKSKQGRRKIFSRYDFNVSIFYVNFMLYET